MVIKLNKQSNHNQQATNLQELFNEVQQGEIRQSELNEKQQPLQKVDILNLPPRKEVHGNAKKRTNLKVSKPFIRLFFVIIILLIIGFGTYYFWGNDLITIINNNF